MVFPTVWLPLARLFEPELADDHGSQVLNLVSDLVTGLGFARINLDGSTTVLWESDTNWPFTPVASPDGRHLAFGVTTSDSDMWTVDLP